MVKQLFGVAGVSFALTAVSVPAFAMSPVGLPEPSSLLVFASGGAGAAAIYAVNRWIRRK